MPEPPADRIAQLTDMGFSETLARNALLLRRGHVEQALDWLLQHGDDPAAAEPPTQEQLRQVGGVGCWRVEWGRARRRVGSILPRKLVGCLQGSDGCSTSRANNCWRASNCWPHGCEHWPTLLLNHSLSCHRAGCHASLYSPHPPAPPPLHPPAPPLPTISRCMVGAEAAGVYAAMLVVVPPAPLLVLAQST